MGVTIEPHIAWQHIGDEVVLVDLRAGDAMGLNTTASFIWSHLDEWSEVQIADAMAQSFQVCQSAAQDDVRAFVESMEQRGFVKVKARQE